MGKKFLNFTIISVPEVNPSIRTDCFYSRQPMAYPNRYEMAICADNGSAWVGNADLPHCFTQISN